MTWDMNKTRELLKLKYGNQQVLAARNAIRGSTARLDHARYHFQELRQLLKQHIDDQLPERHLLELTLVGPSAAVMNEVLTKVEANMIACAQSVHAIPDAMAHVVFFAAGLNLKPEPMPDRYVSLRTVFPLLVKDKRFEGVAAIFEAMKADAAWVALDEIVNYGKHRGLPDPVLQLEPANSSLPYAMMFPSFRYGNEVRPEVEVEELLRPAYELMSRTVVDTGKAINEAMER